PATEGVIVQRRVDEGVALDHERLSAVVDHVAPRHRDEEPDAREVEHDVTRLAAVAGFRGKVSPAVAGDALDRGPPPGLALPERLLGGQRGEEFRLDREAFEAPG